MKQNTQILRTGILFVPRKAPTGRNAITRKVGVDDPPRRALRQLDVTFDSGTLAGVTDQKLPLRAKVATSVSKTAAALSRKAGRGDGSVIGGWIGLKIDPDLLAHLSGDRAGFRHQR